MIVFMEKRGKGKVEWGSGISGGFLGPGGLGLHQVV
jgi:hypothetical protein